MICLKNVEIGDIFVKSSNKIENSAVVNGNTYYRALLCVVTRIQGSSITILAENGSVQSLFNTYSLMKKVGKFKKDFDLDENLKFVKLEE